jgi:hypothetical protein
VSAPRPGWRQVPVRVLLTLNYGGGYLDDITEYVTASASNWVVGWFWAFVCRNSSGAPVRTGTSTETELDGVGFDNLNASEYWVEIRSATGELLATSGPHPP